MCERNGERERELGLEQKEEEAERFPAKKSSF